MFKIPETYLTSKVRFSYAKQIVCCCFQEMKHFYIEGSKEADKASPPHPPKTKHPSTTTGIRRPLGEQQTVPVHTGAESVVSSMELPKSPAKNSSTIASVSYYPHYCGLFSDEAARVTCDPVSHSNNLIDAPS